MWPCFSLTSCSLWIVSFFFLIFSRSGWPYWPLKFFETLYSLRLFELPQVFVVLLLYFFYHLKTLQVLDFFKDPAILAILQPWMPMMSNRSFLSCGVPTNPFLQVSPSGLIGQGAPCGLHHDHHNLLETHNSLMFWYMLSILLICCDSLEIGKCILTRLSVYWSPFRRATPNMNNPTLFSHSIVSFNFN